MNGGEPKKHYLDAKRPDAKAWHHKQNRIGLQESCPQNNFRRIIATLIPKGEFCNHKINYFPEVGSKFALPVLLGLLNSNLADWYFRLGSTNASVSHYQLYNLPAPHFASTVVEQSRAAGEFEKLLVRKDWNAVFATAEPLLAEPPFPAPVLSMLVRLVEAIIDVESRRGDIARTERSALAPEAQPYQDLIDRMLYRMAGLTDEEAAGLERRLETML